MEKEITIPRKWLERLIERAELLQGKVQYGKAKHSIEADMLIIGLIGYIESAKDLLK